MQREDGKIDRGGEKDGLRENERKLRRLGLWRARARQGLLKKKQKARARAEGEESESLFL